ncbi:MAG TPA: type II toxin-antitoxin system RelE/ParE family toxin [Candidatus Dormibacteraeota bacterium]|nr:type II toxin-antitoxin system RelE/ParE family toxin [Candidatus Dormibacteraeota bacterium]
MARIKWLPEAIDDFERLYYFLLGKDVDAAYKAANSILKGTDLLKDTPRIGRHMPDNDGKREIFVAFAAGAYVIRYKFEAEDTIVIIRIWHSRENRT